MLNWILTLILFILLPVAAVASHDVAETPSQNLHHALTSNSQTHTLRTHDLSQFHSKVIGTASTSSIIVPPYYPTPTGTVSPVPTVELYPPYPAYPTYPYQYPYSYPSYPYSYGYPYNYGYYPTNYYNPPYYGYPSYPYNVWW